MKRLSQGAVVGGLLIAAVGCGEGGRNGPAGPVTAPVIELSPQIPPDVDTAKQQELTRAGAFPRVQRLFDEYSWRSFVALNWPRNEEGQPSARLTDEGTLYWETYSESYEVFKADGSAPDPYGQPRRILPPVGADGPPDLGDAVLQRPGHRVLHTLSSTADFNVLDEVDQAFSSPLWDRHGNLVRYEALLNEAEYDYIEANALYSLQGQVAYHEKNGFADFPSGEFGTDSVGAIELKLAWRVMTKEDVTARYLVRDAFILADQPPRWEEVQVGLVGMHISHKTKSSPQWIWSTFEHVDNLRVNDFEAFGPNAPDHPKVPSFNDPGCEYCPVNVVPTPDEDGRMRTQVTRVVPIPKATQDYNRQVQEQLAALGSPLRFYELVNTQWPTDPSAPPAAIDDFPANIRNKSGGKPTPVLLINTVMETYFQGGAAPKKPHGKVQLVVDGGTPVTVPSTNGGNTPLAYAEGFCDSVDDCGAAGKNLVLSTESCMGCHSSAPIAIGGSGPDPKKYTFGGQLSGDFSWLLKQKARPRTGD